MGRISKFFKRPTSTQPTQDAALGSQNPASRTHESSVDRDVSLWDVAYDQLKHRNSRLIKEYEDLISQQDQGDHSDKPVSLAINPSTMDRRDYMRAFTDASIERFASNQSKVLQRLTDASAVVFGLKNWISEAVKASPEASMVWAGICVALPLIENMKNSQETHDLGFLYVTSRMKYYTAIESVIVPDKDARLPVDLVSAHRQELVLLYERIVEYQAQSVLRLFRNRIGTITRDALKLDEWGKLLSLVKESETTVATSARQINSALYRVQLSKLESDSSRSLGLFESLVGLAHKQAQLAEQGVALAVAQLSVAEGVHARQGEALEVMSQHLKTSKQVATRQVTKEEEECIQVFRHNQQDYQAHKDRVGDRLEGTCQWLLTHEYFTHWLEQDSAPLLISADPGCGKSVLAKHLVDSVLPKYGTVCYFFFKDQAQNKSEQALCALIHQLLSQQPALIHHAMDGYRKHGRTLIETPSALWTIFQSLLTDASIGSTICVLDALDECSENDMRYLRTAIKKLFEDVKSKNFPVRILMTSRPYYHIVAGFRDLQEDFPNIQIPGEDELSTIATEINIVIGHRVKGFAKKHGLTARLEDRLTSRLLEIPHRTYLWVHMVFDYLDQYIFRKTNKAVDDAIRTLPDNVEEAYEQILRRAQNPRFAFRILCIVVAAAWPLSVGEMNEIANIEDTTTSLESLDLESTHDFKSTIRRECGLFVSIWEDRVYLIHQTAREFLLSKSASNMCYLPSMSNLVPDTWAHTLSEEIAHGVLGNSCLTYLGLSEFRDVDVAADMPRETVWPNPDFWLARPWINTPTFSSLSDRHEALRHRHHFWRYATTQWVYHVRQSQSAQLQLDSRCSVLYDASGPLIWLGMPHPDDIFGRGALSQLCFYSSFALCAGMGLLHAVQYAINQGVDVNPVDPARSVSPLRAACNSQRFEVAELLLRSGADPHDHYLRRQDHAQNDIPSTRKYYLLTSLVSHVLGVWSEYSPEETLAIKRLIALFLDLGADPAYEGVSTTSATSLRIATIWGNVEILTLLLGKTKRLDVCGLLLHSGSDYSSFWGGPHPVDIAQLFLDHGANPNMTNDKGQTALFYKEEVKVVEFLIRNGAKVDVVDLDGRTPLHYVDRADQARALIKHGIPVNAQDHLLNTPLHCCFRYYSESVFTKSETISCLLELGADVHARDSEGRTPLHWVGFWRTTKGEPVFMLVNAGAEVNATDSRGHTPIHVACNQVHCNSGVLGALIKAGGDVNARTPSGQTPLHLACSIGDEWVVDILLENGAQTEITDDKGRTPLHYATTRSLYCAAVLLQRGADIHAYDNDRITPMGHALRNQRPLVRSTTHETMILYLLQQGANREDGSSTLDLAAAPIHPRIYIKRKGNMRMLMYDADPRRARISRWAGDISVDGERTFEIVCKETTAEA